jgi:hypothetical protein
VGENIKMNTIKYLNLVMIILLLIGTQSCQNRSVSNQKISACPKELTTKLENVKNIELTSATTTVDGQTANNRPIGYQFTAKKGQRLMYKIKPNSICPWVYDPNNKLIDSPILPLDGTYVLQIFSSEGSGTFQLDLSINDVDKVPDPVASKTPASPPISIQASPIVDRPSVVEAVKTHYQLINNKDIDASWKDLSDSFKGSNLTKGEKEYKEWWNQVKTININSTRLIRQDKDIAIVKVGLTYTLTTGRVVDDVRNRIYLIWDDSNQKWLINDKK